MKTSFVAMLGRLALAFALAACGSGPGSGPVVAAGAASLGDSAQPAGSGLCCVVTAANPGNVHCALGAVAACSSGDPSATTTNGAACYDDAIGTSCTAWPASEGSPIDCADGEPCCMGTVAQCPGS